MDKKNKQAVAWHTGRSQVEYWQTALGFQARQTNRQALLPTWERQSANAVSLG